MPEWGDERWPRPRRSPADSIRPPKPPRKDSCPLGIGLIAVAAALSLTALVTFVHIVVWVFAYADEAAAAGLFGLFVLTHLGRS